MKIIATFSSLMIASAIVASGCTTRPAEDSNAPKPPAETSADRSDAAAKKSTATTARTKRPAARTRTDKPSSARVRTAETVIPPTKIKSVQPLYPAVARAARVEGAVVLAVEVGEDGKVSDARVIRSVPLLDQAALDAVRQWEYTPMRRGNIAVPTTMTVTVNFTRA
jgi:TonB family protein